ncbi:MAG: 4-hydroxy-3-methylbut-2-enyl diphosphate reductase [Acidobacteria bacterium]|nr:4-hydroxy-3-methylbut-2-enyl diphosphate reductase [Acidobacteriota bacterium]
MKRAMDAVLEASAARDGSRVQTLGPLIHNPQALELIGQRGVSVTQAPSEVQAGTVVIRAHGIPIQDLRGLKQRQEAGELKVVNATCPEVAKVHSRIKKFSPKGYFTIILGSHGHAESEAHRSFAESGSRIVANMAEAEALTDAELARALVVAQTTFTVTEFGGITDYIRSRAGDLIVENTICDDTWMRQDEAHRIAASVDQVIIVGGKNSANTRHLAELAAHHGKPYQYVETAAELELGGFRGHETVGVLAGASTPTWLVDEVVDVLEQLGDAPGRFTSFLKGGLAAPGLLALGSAFMTLGVHAWMGLPRTLAFPLLTGGYVLAMYLLTPYVDPLGLGSKGPARARFLQRNRRALLGVGILSLAGSLGIAASLGLLPLAVMAGASVLGVAYTVRLPFAGGWSLRAIPGSKDIMVSAALAVVAVGMPLLHGGGLAPGRAAAAFFFVAVLGFARTVVSNIRDMQHDQILGRETLPILVGRRNAKLLTAVLLTLACLLAGGLSLAQLDLPRALLALPVLGLAAAYPLVHLWYFHERFTVGKGSFRPSLDLGLFLLALLALP